MYVSTYSRRNIRTKYLDEKRHGIRLSRGNVFEKAVWNQILSRVYIRASCTDGPPKPSVSRRSGTRRRWSTRRDSHGDGATVRKVAKRRDLVEKLPAAVTIGGRQVASNYCKQLRLMRRLTPRQPRAGANVDANVPTPSN